MIELYVQLAPGQGFGVIRAEDGRKLFFHRSDVTGTLFHGLAVGDRVECGAILDSISGARAVNVRRRR